MPTINTIQTNTTEVPLTRPHKLYGTCPAVYDRVITFDRYSFKYICGSPVVSGTFSSSGLAEFLVGDDSLFSIAFDDTSNIPALILDRVQIGT